MAWAKEKPSDEAPKPREETTWFSAYPDSSNRWHEAFKPFYDLVGEYEIDEKHTLYRYQVNESQREHLHAWAPKFHNVVISHSAGK